MHQIQPESSGTTTSASNSSGATPGASVTPSTVSPEMLAGYGRVLSLRAPSGGVFGSAAAKVTQLGSTVLSLLPANVKSVVDRWNEARIPPVRAWVSHCLSAVPLHTAGCGCIVSVRILHL